MSLTKNYFRLLWLFTKIVILSSILLTGCGGNNNSSLPDLPNIAPGPINSWTWVSGSNIHDKAGSYGTKSSPDSANIPGARHLSITWVDSNDNLWLFGGGGFDSMGSSNPLNDLWKFDGTSWTWVSGSNLTSEAGIYGTKGMAAAINVPGARTSPISWIDSNNNMWLFGGYGHDSLGQYGSLNDLWKFDGANWTWISGSNTRTQAGNYGAIGITAATNVPGARSGSIAWTDSNDNLWLFGGSGYNSLGEHGQLNDLWKFDGTNWTWISGSDTRNQTGNYGTKGVTAATNVPGARSRSIAWIDSNDNMWLFGGLGYDNRGVTGWLNDLWKFDGTNWTWISGSDTTNQAGNYGTKGVTAAANLPGGRHLSINWTDSDDNLWLLGGNGYNSSGEYGVFNDLWKFDGTNWTWISGSNIINQNSSYGTKDITAATNAPGARNSSISWIDKNNNLWLFGGYGSNSSGQFGLLNDLWIYQH